MDAETALVTYLGRREHGGVARYVYRIGKHRFFIHLGKGGFPMLFLDSEPGIPRTFNRRAPVALDQYNKILTDATTELGMICRSLGGFGHQSLIFIGRTPSGKNLYVIGAALRVDRRSFLAILKLARPHNEARFVADARGLLDDLHRPYDVAVSHDDIMAILRATAPPAADDHQAAQVPEDLSIDQATVDMAAVPSSTSLLLDGIPSRLPALNTARSRLRIVDGIRDVPTDLLIAEPSRAPQARIIVTGPFVQNDWTYRDLEAAGWSFPIARGCASIAQQALLIDRCVDHLTLQWNGGRWRSSKCIIHAHIVFPAASLDAYVAFVKRHMVQPERYFAVHEDKPLIFNNGYVRASRLHEQHGKVWRAYVAGGTMSVEENVGDEGAAATEGAPATEGTAPAERKTLSRQLSLALSEAKWPEEEGVIAEQLKTLDRFSVRMDEVDPKMIRIYEQMERLAPMIVDGTSLIKEVCTDEADTERRMDALRAKVREHLETIWEQLVIENLPVAGAQRGTRGECMDAVARAE